MKHNRLSIISNILIKLLTIIILASLCGAKYLGILSTIVNAEDNSFSFSNIFNNNPIFNMVNATSTMEGTYNVTLTVKQYGNTVTLNASKDITYVNETFLCYDYMYSDDGSTWHTLDVLPTSTYTTTYVPGRKYKAQIRVVVINYYTLIEDAYNKFFNRSADASGLSTWGSNLTNHSINSTMQYMTGVAPQNEIAGLSFAIVFSIEYLNGKWQSEGIEGLIKRLYKFALGRSSDPSAAEISNWKGLYDRTTGSITVNLDRTYTLPRGMTAVINGICTAGTEAQTWHSTRYYYNPSTGQYTYATATLNDTTNYYKDSPVISPSTLSIDPNGGSVAVISPSGGTAQTITSTTAFKQFASVSTSNKSELTLGTPTKDNTEVVIDNYTITYNANNGTLGTITGANTDAINKDTTVYTFGGWTKSPTTLNGTLGTTTYVFPDTNGKSDSITASWNSTTTNSTTSVTLPNATRPGYTIRGWYTAASGGTKVGNPGETYIPTGNTTLFAQWNANTYTIEYDLGGGTAGANQPTSGTYDAVVNISNPTKEGNIFTGWVMINGNTSTALYGTATNAVNNSWNPGYTLVTAEYFKDLRNDTGTVTLVANWMSYRVNIRILPNNGTLVRQHGSSYSTIVENGITYITRSGSKIIQSIEYGDRLLSGGLIDYNNASALNLERLGYRVNDNAVYKNEATNQTYNQVTLYQASDFADCSNGDQTVDLTVNWQPITYNVTYDLDGGTNNPSNPTQFTIDTFVTNIQNPEKIGYNFIGWSKTVDSLDWKTGYLNADTGLEEMDTQYENSYYSGYVSVTRGTTYTLSGYGSYNPQNIEWRLYYVEDGNTYFYGSSTGSSFSPTNTDHKTYKFRLILREASTETQRNNIVVSGGLESLTKINSQSTGNVHLLAHWDEKIASVVINKNNSIWPNSGMHVELYQNNNPIHQYSNAEIDPDNPEIISWGAVDIGTYDVYASKNNGELNTLVDTGVDITVTDNGTATIDYYTLTLNKGVGISAVSGAGTYLKNQTANINATVSSGYTWEGWSVISGNSPE